MVDLIIITEKMAELDEDGFKRVVRQALRVGVPAADIINAAVSGIDEVEHFFEIGEYSICDLIMAGTILGNILRSNELKTGISHLDNAVGGLSGRVVLSGTVVGDTQDPRKVFFHSMLSSMEFKVIDLGSNISAEAFYKAARKNKPDIIALNIFQDNCTAIIGETIRLLKDDPETHGIFLLLSGHTLNKDCQELKGADGYACSTWDSVKLCIQYENKKGEPLHAAD